MKRSWLLTMSPNYHAVWHLSCSGLVMESPRQRVLAKHSCCCRQVRMTWYSWILNCPIKAVFNYYLKSAACIQKCRCSCSRRMLPWILRSKRYAAGARDYLLKPIDPEAILARVHKILEEQKQPKRRREITTQIQALLAELRSADANEPAVYGFGQAVPPVDPARFLKRGQLVLDLHIRQVLLGDRNISLPPSTFDYLATLVRHSPQTVSYDTLVLESQGYQGLSRNEAKEITRWQIHEIRKVLEGDPRHPRIIITVRDIGYRLVI